jgi:type I restriction enzyme S subunit
VIVKSVNLNVMLSDKILRLVFVDDEIKPWLLYLLRSKLGRKQIEFLATGNQESMKNIGQERIRSIAIPIAPKNEMSEAMALVEQASDSANQQTLANDRLLKQSTAQRQNILKAAFSGQLVPQDPSDEPASELLERIRAERAAQQAVKKPRGRKAKEAA